MEVETLMDIDNSQEQDEEEILKEDEEDHQQNAFTEYVTEAQGLAHPTALWEGSALSSFSVSSRVTFRNPYLVTFLSSPQVEAVQLIVQAHDKMIDGSTRLGFLLGDGTGTGKSRIGVGIILENYHYENRKRSLWVTPNSALAPSITKEFESCQIIPTIQFNGKVPAEQEGILICTYNDVSSKLEMLTSWLIGTSESFEGNIIFDECHRVKNSGTSNAKSALQIQSDLPGARVLYVSATASSELATLEYMPRLGLWGQHLPFPDFQSFFLNLSSRGTLSLECVSLELKMQGRYICRQLRFDGADFGTTKIAVTPEQKQLYADSADLWVKIRNAIINDSDERQAPNGAGKTVWSQFYSSHQRFFRSLLVSFKIDHVVQIAQSAEKKGQSVVISLIKTGEANLKNDNDDSGSSVASIAKTLAEKLITDPGIRAQLLDSIDSLSLPPNPLDELIHKLGGSEKVAELTGRRMKFDLDTKKNVSRGKGKNLNKNLADFQNGHKHFAIISAVASVGLSLHNDKNEPVNRRRFHIMIELPWTAEECVQVMGRTFRSNQYDSPIYRVIVMDVSGETRFAATIANRLQNMGALVNGNRESISQYIDFKEFNFDNEVGNEAVIKLFEALTSGGSYAVPENRTPQQLATMFSVVLTKFHGVDLCDKDGKRNPKIYTAMKFFNRLLGISIPVQNFIFDYYSFIFEKLMVEKGADIQQGVKVATVKNIQVVQSQAFEIGVSESDLTIQVVLHKLSHCVSIPFKDAYKMFQTSEKGQLVGFWRSKTVNCVRPSVKLVIRNNGKYRTFMSNFGPIGDKYSNSDGFEIFVNSLDARDFWENQRILHGQLCWHKYRTDNCTIRNCEFGKTTQNVFVLSGSLVSAISLLPFLKQITLVKFSYEGKEVCGIKIPENQVDTVLEILRI